ncbi:hypothetical protein RRG08_013874 [Elysia crispata]|uniref:Uncharacterized protein n=1 Tax=Elysia crispata TaxID=231223 RepID=A0AAE0YLG9_9GAST|nr:hypothetical protein RRG08_013874 [Elysia crispata]
MGIPYHCIQGQVRWQAPLVVPVINCQGRGRRRKDREQWPDLPHAADLLRGGYNGDKLPEIAASSRKLIKITTTDGSDNPASTVWVEGLAFSTQYLLNGASRCFHTISRRHQGGVKLGVQLLIRLWTSLTPSQRSPPTQPPKRHHPHVTPGVNHSFCLDLLLQRLRTFDGQYGDKGEDEKGRERGFCGTEAAGSESKRARPPILAVRKSCVHAHFNPERQGELAQEAPSGSRHHIDDLLMMLLPRGCCWLKSPSTPRQDSRS